MSAAATMAATGKKRLKIQATCTAFKLKKKTNVNLYKKERQKTRNNNKCFTFCCYRRKKEKKKKNKEQRISTVEQITNYAAVTMFDVIHT